MCLEMEMEGPRQTTHPRVYQELLKVWEVDGSDMYYPLPTAAISFVCNVNIVNMV